MVLNIPALYPGYGINAQQDRQRRAVTAQRPVFIPENTDIDIISRDVNTVRNIVEQGTERGSDLFSIIRNGWNNLTARIDNLDENSRALRHTENALFGLSVIPTFRRLNSLPKDIEEDHLARAGMMLGVTAASLPGDGREVMFAAKDIGNIYRSGGHLSALQGNAVRNSYQHGLALFKGTLVEHLIDLNKHPWLQNLDRTLYDTRFGEFTRRIFNIKQIDFMKRIVGGREIAALKFGGNWAQRLGGRALLRTPILGLALAAAMEVPALVKSAMVEGSFIDKAGSFTKQLCKSAAFVGMVQGGISLVGGAAVMMFPAAGAVAALAGMAIGSTGAVILSKAVNKQIDKLFD